MSPNGFFASLKSAYRSAGLGKLYRLGGGKPLDATKRSIRKGLDTFKQSMIREGWRPSDLWRTQRGKEGMIEAAEGLPEIDPPPSPPKPMKVHFLTGADHWYQSLFCFLSLQRFCEDRITPVLYSDGSLAGPIQNKFRRVVPWVEIQAVEDIENRLDKALPKSDYPLLRKWRHNQLLIRKITDPHAGSGGWKLLLDSDMLFFRRPQFLIDYLRRPKKPCYMVDIDTYHGYSPQLRYRMADGPIPEAINAGICGLKSDDVDFDRLQQWLQVMLEEEGTSYHLGQGLISLMLAGRKCAVAPPSEYVVLPSLGEVKSPTATLHHYVAESRRSYFQYGWRHVFEDVF